MRELPVTDVECEDEHLATFVCVRVDNDVSVSPRLGSSLERPLYLAGHHSNTYAPVGFTFIHGRGDHTCEQSCDQPLEQRCAKDSTHGCMVCTALIVLSMAL